MTTSAQVNQTLDHFFRREAGRVIAILTKKFGTAHIDLAETVVQDALVKAAQTWSISGIPENPAAWIMRTAKNRAIDLIRSGREQYVDQESLIRYAGSSEESRNMNLAFEKELEDDQLKMMFVCCHPVVSHDSRIVLTLKAVCGFGVSEIARAFLSAEDSVAQRLVRAKRRIKDAQVPFDLPDPQYLGERLDAVLDTIYLLFNEGYSASEGDQIIRRDFCDEATRLVRLLANHPILATPKVKALAALLLLQSSRFDARIDGDNQMLVLEDQNRLLWDQTLIHEGLALLDLAGEGPELSEFHLYAGIAACHATATDFGSTDWRQILSFYDALTTLTSSPVVSLNRAVAVAFVSGMESGIAELKKIKDVDQLKDYYLLPATFADLYRRLGRFEDATKYFKKALKLARIEPEKRFLQKKMDSCVRQSDNSKKVEEN